MSQQQQKTPLMGILDASTAADLLALRGEDMSDSVFHVLASPISISKKQQTATPTKTKDDIQVVLLADEMDPTTLLLLLCFGLFSSLLLKGVLVEGVLNGGFKFAWYSAVFESTLASLFSFAELLYLLDAPEKGFFRSVIMGQAWKTKLLISLCMTVSKGLTWVAFTRLSYASTTMLKSCKLVSVMVGGLLFLGKSYHLGDYFAAMLVALGVTFFSFSDSKQSEDSGIGIAAGIISLIADAVAMNLQEKLLRKSDKNNNDDNKNTSNSGDSNNNDGGNGGAVSIPELMLTTSALSSLGLTVIAVWLSSETGEVIQVLTEKPSIIFEIFLLSALGHVGNLMRNTIIGTFGSLTASLASLARQFFAVMLSYFMFPKPFTQNHILGLAFFLIGSTMGAMRGRKQKKKKD